jgi:hypothetical protein
VLADGVSACEFTALDTGRAAGAEYCRGYIQYWTGTGNPIPERSAQRIFRVADQISSEPARIGPRSRHDGSPFGLDVPHDHDHHPAARLRRAGRLASRLRRLTQQSADDAIALEAAIGRLGIGPDHRPDRRSGRS